MILGGFMAAQIAIDPPARADHMAKDGTHELTRDLAYQRLAIVNVVFYGDPDDDEDTWMLIDAGMKGTAGLIRKAAERRFGPDSKPSGIILTHGHFDHVGALHDLAEQWRIPIYAHRLEAPYLDGRASYPPPDPSVGGGLMARMAGLYPRGPVNVSRWLRLLPSDGSVPYMPGWQWLPTPGHTPGHISLWRAEDRLLVAGDAFITTRQESVFSVATQRPELHGPPMYYTSDWESARDSVERLAALEPRMVVAGHGAAMQGPIMQSALKSLAERFDQVAVPKHGRYVHHPVRADETGPTYIPPNR
jgi:glyoxylase-like metal-dependent hydrolase (beta-lactamase superfamily II)